jgi:hypothetical protein
LRASHAIVFALVFASGCLSKRTIDPLDPSARAEIVVIDDHDGPVAYAWTTTAAVSLDIPAASNTTIYALAYTCDRSDLGIVFGDGGRISTTDPPLGPLPAAHAIFEIDPASGETTRLSTTPPALGGLNVSHVPNASRCAKLSTASVAFPDIVSGVMHGTFPIDQRSAMMVGEDFTIGARAFTVTRTATGAFAKEVPINPFRPDNAAYFDRATGEVWVIGWTGATQHGKLPDGFVSIDDAPIDHQGENGLWIDGVRDGTRTEFILIGSSGIVVLFQNKKWIPIFAQKMCAQSDHCLGAVRWVRDSTYLIGRPGIAGIVHVDSLAPGFGLTTSPLPIESAYPRGFAVGQDGAIYVHSVNASAEVHRSIDGGYNWTTLANRSQIYLIEDIITLGDLVFYVYGGQLYQISDLDRPECPSVPLSKHVTTSTIVGSRLLFGAQGETGVRAVFVDVTPPPPLVAPPRCN